MLTHIVLFKLKERSPANVAATRDRIAMLAGQIPELLSIEVGVNVVDSPRAYDIALVETFESVEAMHAYQVHPVHLALLADVMPRFEEFNSVDYENAPFTGSRGFN
jgi:hypothetical protein